MGAPALKPFPPLLVVPEPRSNCIEGRIVYTLPVSCERSSRVMPAGLPMTVEASCPRAARPAAAVPRSGVPFS
jgi:hypothetical protein